ncbi:MAG: hypothetical protein IJ003_00905 [Candidatus Gastranaerophilales bacterium]|nr:hypothetical protein [Candidatus Gastranaerophilales bacterium]
MNQGESLGSFFTKMKNIKTFKTQDGSIGLYNEELNEVYHSKFGAKKEAYEKFIAPALILNNRSLDILDICYGIGYNTKCAIENFSNINSIDCIEIDNELVSKSYEFDYDEKINQIIKDNLQKSDFIHFYIEDARSAIKKIDKKYDIIFHDGFAPHKQSILWSEEFIKLVASKLKDNGIYCTYNHSKPVLNALCKMGLFLGQTIVDNKIIGTVASFDKNLIKNPLISFELGKLNTKSAITYKDKDLNLSHEEIIKNRDNEVNNSKLQTLSGYLKTVVK